MYKLLVDVCSIFSFTLGIYLGVGDEPLEEGTATHSSILAWRIPWTEEPGGYSPQGHKESGTTEVSEQHSSKGRIAGS